MAKQIGHRSKKAKTAVEIIAEKEAQEKVQKAAKKTTAKSKKDGEK